MKAHALLLLTKHANHAVLWQASDARGRERERTVAPLHDHNPKNDKEVHMSSVSSSWLDLPHASLLWFCWWVVEEDVQRDSTLEKPRKKFRQRPPIVQSFSVEFLIPRI